MKVHVFLNEGPDHFFGYNSLTADLKLALVDEADPDNAPVTVEDDVWILDTYFEWLNADPELVVAAEIWRREGHRSLSVGDVIVLDGERAYACAPLGWDRLEDGAVRVVEL